MSEPPNKKLRSANDDPNGPGASANDVFQGILQSKKIRSASKFGFQHKFAKVKGDTKFLKDLQGLIAAEMDAQVIREAELHQEYSRLNTLDAPIRQILVGYLDEEGLWALEKATMMELEDAQVDSQWMLLKEKQQQPIPFPWDFNKSAPQIGRLFGKVSSFARQMEKAAQQHYGDENASPPSWPDNFFDISIEECSSEVVTFFARISLQQEDGSTMVLEGFPSFQNEDEHEVLKLKFDKFPSDSKIQQKFDHFGASSCDSKVWLEAKDKARSLGNRLTITLIAVKRKQRNVSIQLVVSTTGFNSWHPGRVYLKHRSTSPADKSYDGSNKFIRVGVGNNIEDRWSTCNKLHIWLYSGMPSESSDEDSGVPESSDEDSDGDPCLGTACLE